LTSVCALLFIYFTASDILPACPPVLAGPIVTGISRDDEVDCQLHKDVDDASLSNCGMLAFMDNALLRWSICSLKILDDSGRDTSHLQLTNSGRVVQKVSHCRDVGLRLK
jgi:hypothetical protein